MKYLLTVAYNGKNYCGYQKQKNGISIQEKLTEASECLFGEGVNITGCSRTDSGVHARGFKATLECRQTSITVDKIPTALNTVLPDDIAVLDAEVVSDTFHPRYDVKSKEYRYIIHDGKVRDPFLSGRAYHYPKTLDHNVMNEAASCFVGEHDFASFMASGSKIVDTVRTVYSCNVTREGDMITVSITGNGFLYNMVRIIVGTLISVSDGKIKPNEITSIISAKDRSRAGSTAPAHGLYLYDVKY